MKDGLRLGEVVVVGQHSDFGLRSSQMSALSITPAQISALPTLLGEVDVLKVLQRLPGVQSGGDGASAIYVRGGDYDQNLILLNGVPLFSAEHLGGYTSAINSDLVDWVDFYRGAFPARYGGRLSSVINVGLRPGLISICSPSRCSTRYMTSLQALGLTPSSTISTSQPG